MVFAINPPDPSVSNNTFEAFQDAAKALGAASSSAAPPSSTSATSPPSTTSTAPSSGITHTITVGDNGNLAYSPNNITAAIGDVLSFEFHPKNHTVTQSTFQAPCSPESAGFDSGLYGLLFFCCT